MNRKNTARLVVAIGTLLTACSVPSSRMTEKSAMEIMPAFGGPANIAYAADLWAALREARLVGPGAVRARPYRGQEPHGAVLVTLEQPLVVHSHMGLAIVKKNFVGEGVTTDSVANGSMQDLDSITVMYQREAGYDPDHKNWYWAKYQWNGSLHVNAMGAKLAGRVAKGANQGCIACHETAPGNDYIFNHDRLAGG